MGPRRFCSHKYFGQMWSSWISLPPMDGINTTTELRRAVPQSAVILLSLQDDTSTRAQAAGVVAFVGMQEGVRALLAAIRQAGGLKRQSQTAQAKREERS